MAVGIVRRGAWVALVGLALAGCDQQPPSTPRPSEKPAAPGSSSVPKAEKPAEPDPMTTPANDPLPTEEVKIAGKTFKLEVANTAETRFKGLSGRAKIAPDGGMLFVFPQNQVDVHGFVMRDCPVPIDIIYLDPAGRITATHKMVPEAPRSEAERKLSPPSTSPPHPSSGWTEWPRWAWSNEAYENRLKRYSSVSASQFVIELAGNTLDTLDLKKGQKIELDLEKLKKAAK